MTIYDFERTVRPTKGQMIYYENTEMDTLRAFRYGEAPIQESDQYAKCLVKEILWGEKHMIVTVEEKLGDTI